VCSSDLQGIQGTTGTSVQGTQGIQGTTGTATQGTQGIQGTTGTSVQGTTGTSVQGAQGIQGTTGTSVQGPAGAAPSLSAGYIAYGGAGNVISGSANLTRTTIPSSAGEGVSIVGSLHVGGSGATITTVGAIAATNDITAFYSSDKRLKENIVPIDNALEKVLQISGVNFDWKSLSQEEIRNIHPNSGYDVGVIAQEIEEVLPEVVTTRETGYKAVKYEKIVPLLIEAIKEQQKQINKLKDKN